MGYLGLSGTPYKEDNLFQRLFWPSDHPGEVDTLGQQGFWVCSIVAVRSCIVLSLQGHWFEGLLSLAFFGLGGMGVREHSRMAAALLVIPYVLMEINGFLTGQLPDLLDLAFAVLLIANIRGTWIANRWAHHGVSDAFPSGMEETLSNRLIDKVPARVWPKGQWGFLGVAGVFTLLLVTGTAGLIRHPRKTSQEPQKTMTLEVKPPAR